MILNGKPINPGELNRRITLLSRTMVKGTGGFQRQTPVPIAPVWARWRDVHGVETWAADTAGAKRAATVLIRYRPDVNETCLVQIGDEIYEIVGLDNIERRNEFIELKVKRWTEG